MEGTSVRVTATSGETCIVFDARPAVLNEAELGQLRNGGILSAIFSELLESRA
jgi:hypothetical protein